MLTDAKRLQQVIKNLLSNAFKFTRQGQVSLTIMRAAGDSYAEHLRHADAVLAFVVSDTGIGIPSDKQQIIFEAFQQADGSTSRKYGGTGLGLAISRELARLLGGEIRLASGPRRGSTFTLFLPTSYFAARATGRFEGPPAPARVETFVDLARRSLEAPGGAGLDRLVAAITGEVRSGDEPDEPAADRLVNEVGDDRDFIQPGDRVLLIVEND